MTDAGNTAQGHAYFQSASSPNRLTKTLFRMKHWGLFFLALCCAACHNDEPEQKYYITLDEDEIRADYSGIQQRIAVSANCDWSIRNIPQWCIIEKAVADNAEYLDIEVLPNDTENPREATITLACLHDRYKQTTADLFVSQAGQKSRNTTLCSGIRSQLINSTITNTTSCRTMSRANIGFRPNSHL